MPDGTEIQIEDWHDNYTAPYASTITAYPISKINCSGTYAPKKNARFRAQFDFPSEAETRDAFHTLISGAKKLDDYIPNLHDPKYAGCIVGDKLDSLEKIKAEILRVCDEHGKKIPRQPDYDICVVLKDLYFFIESLEGEKYDISKDLHFLDRYKNY